MLASIPIFLLSLASLAWAWLPSSPPSGVTLSAFTKGKTSKIRGVNLGSQFIVEPWMAQQEWINMGCSGAEAEFQCIQNNYGGDITKASAAWKKHWASWITQSDITTMVSYGLNTIRIPVGWWMREDLVQSGEYFPKGGFAYLQAICGYAAAAGMYVIIDMHAAPGTQDAHQAFTGNYTDTPYFYQSDYQSGRAYEFLSWMTTQIHTNTQFRTVGTIEVLNEPKMKTDDGDTRWMVEHFYGSAIDSIRNAEAAHSITGSSRLHISIMDDKWGSGGDNPTSSLSSSQKQMLLFDDHNYVQANVIGQNENGVIAFACTDVRSTSLQPANTKVVGEFSMLLSQTGNGFTPETSYKSFYSSFFSAQQWQYEKTNGWIYWTWKTDTFDRMLQWSYSGAVQNGLISKNLGAQLAANPCSGYS